MKITIEHKGVKCTIEDEEAYTLNDAIILCQRAVNGVGFYWNDCDEGVESK